MKAWNTYSGVAALLGLTPEDDEKALVDASLVSGRVTRLQGVLLAGCLATKGPVQARSEVQGAFKELRAVVGKGQEKMHLPEILLRKCQETMVWKQG